MYIIAIGRWYRGAPTWTVQNLAFALPKLMLFYYVYIKTTMGQAAVRLASTLLAISYDHG